MPGIEARIAVASADVKRVFESDSSERVTPCIVNLASQAVAEAVPVLNRQCILVAYTVVVVLRDRNEARIGGSRWQTTESTAVAVSARGTGVHIGVDGFGQVVTVITNVADSEDVVIGNLLFDFEAPLDVFRRGVSRGTRGDAGSAEACGRDSRLQLRERKSSRKTSKESVGRVLRLTPPRMTVLP